MKILKKCHTLHLLMGLVFQISVDAITKLLVDHQLSCRKLSNFCVLPFLCLIILTNKLFRMSLHTYDKYLFLIRSLFYLSDS